MVLISSSVKYLSLFLVIFLEIVKTSFPDPFRGYTLSTKLSLKNCKVYGEKTLEPL
jgi:hypothetical protein